MRSRKISVIVAVICVMLVSAFIVAVCTKHKHEFSSWVEVEVATCTDGGLLRRDCLGCSYFETKPTSPLGHSFGDWEDQTLPTCEHPGVQVKRCIRCGVIDTETR